MRTVTMTMTRTEVIFVRAALINAHNKAKELWAIENEKYGIENLGVEVLNTYEEAIAITTAALRRTREG